MGRCQEVGEGTHWWPQGWLGKMVLSYVKGNLLLFKFYLANISKLHQLPQWMRNPDTLQEVVEGKVAEVGGKERFTLKLSRAVARNYNGEFDRLKADLRQLHAGEKELISYKTTLLILFSIRLACVVTAWQGRTAATLLLAASQFLVAPYSLFVSMALAVALAPPIYLSHYVSLSLIQACASIMAAVTPETILSVVNVVAPYCHLPIGPAFVIGFFLADQALCVYCHAFTPSKEFPLKETFTHAVWGFLNTKTYTLVVLLHMMNAGVAIPLWLWALDAYFKVTERLAYTVSRHWAHWLELFYHQHRMAHLPKVYEHAHKLHHYLHGTLAFDAHIYGNGMPEEFFFLLLEMGLGIGYGLTPATLNRLVLQFSMDNKFGHTQKPTDEDGGNFHADHHLLHVKNFGIYNCLTDMYFDTGNNNTKYVIKPSLYCPTDTAPLTFSVEREQTKDDTLFHFTPTSF